MCSLLIDDEELAAVDEFVPFAVESLLLLGVDDDESNEFTKVWDSSPFVFVEGAPVLTRKVINEEIECSSS
jgi:hypothetical protein